MWKNIRKFIPSLASILFWVGMQMSGIQIPWLGYLLMGLAVLLLLIPSWPWVIKLTYRIANTPRQNTILRIISVIIAILIVGGVDIGIYKLVKGQSPILQQPNSPTVILSPNPNPIKNTPTSSSLVITVTPYFNPPYQSYVQPVITNNNSAYCDMVLEFDMAGGFKFSEVSNVPENFKIQDGYIDNNKIIISIKDCPPNWRYSDFKIPVYTMNPDTASGSENEYFTSKLLTKGFSK
jgi:hypothetical protein